MGHTNLRKISKSSYQTSLWWTCRELPPGLESFSIYFIQSYILSFAQFFPTFKCFPIGNPNASFTSSTTASCWFLWSWIHVNTSFRRQYTKLLILVYIRHIAQLNFLPTLMFVTVSLCTGSLTINYSVCILYFFPLCTNSLTLYIHWRSLYIHRRL